MFALLIIVAYSRGDIAAMTYGDGLIYRYVASHLDTPAPQIDPVVSARGTSLRYGRIGLPSVLLVGSAGRPALMRYVQPVVMILCGAGAGALATMLFPGLGLLAAGLPFLAPGFSLAVSGGFAEALAVPVCLGAVLAALHQRWGLASAAMAFALLTRENTMAVLGALVIVALLARAWRGAAILCVAIVPLAAWSIFVQARYGHIPMFDPYLRDITDTVGPPFVALAKSLLSPASAGALVIVVVHLVIALGSVALLIRRRSTLTIVAVTCASQVIISAPFAWELLGEAARTAVFLQLFALLAVVAWKRPDAGQLPS